MNLPNKLSVLRLCLIPVFMITFYVNFPCHYLVSGLIFAIAACTDFLDGYIARKYNLVTDLGKFLDGCADKVLVLTACILLLDGKLITSDVLPTFIGGTLVSLILAREILISCLRMVTAKKGVVIAADRWGKLKTIFQDVSIVILMVAAELLPGGALFGVFGDSGLVHNVIYFTGFGLFAVAVVLTVVSGIHYLAVYGNTLESKSK